MRQRRHEHRAQRFHAGAVVVVEAAGARAVHVPYAQQRTVVSTAYGPGYNSIQAEPMYYQHVTSGAGGFGNGYGFYGAGMGTYGGFGGGAGGAIGFGP